MGRVQNKRCPKVKTLCQFPSNPFETNKMWTQHIGARVLLVSERWDGNLRGAIFCDTDIWSRKYLKRGLTLASCSLAIETPYPPLPPSGLGKFIGNHSIYAVIEKNLVNHDSTTLLLGDFSAREPRLQISDFDCLRVRVIFFALNHIVCHR